MSAFHGSDLGAPPRPADEQDRALPDHLVKQENGIMLSSVTSDHYVHADDQELRKKRKSWRPWRRGCARSLANRTR
jgi:hypothetical protein